MSQTKQDNRGPEVGSLQDKRVTGYVLGELTAAERAAFEAELSRSDLLRLQVYEMEKLVGRLRAVPPERASRDLGPGILDRIQREEFRVPWLAPSFWRPALAASAGALLLLGGWLVIRVDPPIAQAIAGEDEAALASGLAWLSGAQTDAGGWNAESFGGQAQYEVALNGLALLALARHAQTVQKHGQRLTQAAGFLLAQQSDNGRFGPECAGMMYNHGIATVALLESYRATQDERLRAPISAALDFLRGQQHASGGWAYTKAPTSRANTSVSAWQLLALVAAVSQGWTECQPALEQGLVWLDGVTDGNGGFGYEQAGHFPEGRTSLASMGAFCVLEASRAGLPVERRLLARAKAGLASASEAAREADYYRDYFRAAAFRAAGGDAYAGALREISTALLAVQVRKEEGAVGSWEPNDRWGGVGGRLYSTAMAMLSLDAGSGVPDRSL